MSSAGQSLWRIPKAAADVEPLAYSSVAAGEDPDSYFGFLAALLLQRGKCVINNDLGANLRRRFSFDAIL